MDSTIAELRERRPKSRLRCDACDTFIALPMDEDGCFYKLHLDNIRENGWFIEDDGGGALVKCPKCSAQQSGQVA